MVLPKPAGDAGNTAQSSAVSALDWPQVYKLSKKSDEFAQFLRDPSVPKPQKAAVLQDVLDSAKVSDITKNFFSAPAFCHPLVLHACA